MAIVRRPVTEPPEELVQRAVELRGVEAVDLPPMVVSSRRRPTPRPTATSCGASMTLLDALDASDVFAGRFSGQSWRRWRVFVKALEGLRLDADELDVYRHHTGRQTSPDARAPEAWLVVGRRGGKSQVAAVVGTWLAVQDYSAHLAPGEVGTVVLIASDRKQARNIRRYIDGLLKASPALEALVVNRTKEGVELSNNVVIEVFTANKYSARGYTVVACLADEVAFWKTDETSANPDVEILDSVRPGMATIPTALLLVLSSPYARRGALWETYRDHFAKDGDPVLVWQGTSLEMNERLPVAVVKRAFARDPASASAEFGAQFRADIESLISDELLTQVVVPQRLELPPQAGVRYTAFCDPSGGQQDSMTLAISHRDDKGRIILDCVREAPAPFSPKQVVAEFAEVLHAYNVGQVTGDRYGGEWPAEAFRERSITYAVAEQTKSELYLALLPLLSDGHVELLDHPRLLAQLRGLDRRVARGGKDSVDHGPRGRDDVANSAAGAVVLAKTQLRPVFGAVRGTGLLGGVGGTGSLGGAIDRYARERWQQRA